MGGISMIERSLSELFEDDDSVVIIYDGDVPDSSDRDNDNCDDLGSRRQSFSNDEETKWQSSYERLTGNDSTDDFNFSMQDLLGPLGCFNSTREQRPNEQNENKFIKKSTSKLPFGIPDTVKAPKITMQLTGKGNSQGKPFDLALTKQYLPSKSKRRSKRRKTKSNSKTKANTDADLLRVIDHVISGDLSASCDLSDLSIDSSSSNGPVGDKMRMPVSIQFSTSISRGRSMDRILKRGERGSTQDTTPKRPSRSKSAERMS